jgi:predicted RNA-binding Zn ribbon-like protein
MPRIRGNDGCVRSVRATPADLAITTVGSKLDLQMWAEHEHPKAAPGELDQIREFVNTRDLETDEDALAEPAAAAEWFASRDLLASSETLTAADVRQAQEMREALRKLLIAHNGGELDDAAADAVNNAAKSAELVVRFDSHGDASLTPVRPGIDGALGRLIAIVYRAMSDGSWERLKACGDETCEWAFYDWSKNRSATWCDMAVCGNRAKARAYRQRRAGVS